jgi:heparan-alpha-glucosaminide N-acetyltransferase
MNVDLLAATRSSTSTTNDHHQVRIQAIDVLRALTMILMIFVNDLWSLTNIPGWLGHVPSGADGIGLADIVFPAFLFIVGLSLPYAIDNRRLRGDDDLQLLVNVVFRSLALLLMGVFLVNGESINEQATGIPRLIWNPLCCLSFIVIWNNYPPTTSKAVVYSIRAVAAGTLVFLAIQYRGEDGSTLFAPQWWGILGLIGWAYLLSGIVTVFARGSIAIVAAAWIFFCLMRIMTHLEMLPSYFSFVPAAIREGTLVALSLGGVLTALLFRHYLQKGEHVRMTIILTFISVLLIGLSMITRPYWGLAKLGATAAWLFLCSAFTIIGFLVVYWTVDRYHKSHWFNIIKPAGTATLLCYLIPYFVYSTTWLLGIGLPDFFLDGAAGLAKSFAFAIFCAVATGALLKIGVRFKV